MPVVPIAAATLLLVEVMEITDDMDDDALYVNGA